MIHRLEGTSIAAAGQIADLLEGLCSEGPLAPMEVGNRMLASLASDMRRLPRAQRDQVLKSDKVTLTIGGREHVLSKGLVAMLNTVVTAAAKWSREDGRDYAPVLVRAIRAVSRVLGRGSEVRLAILRDSPGGSLVEIGVPDWPSTVIPTQVAFLTLRAFGLSNDQLSSWEVDPIVLSL